MKYADLRQALKNCTNEKMFDAFIVSNLSYRPLGNFYGLCKIIAEEAFLFGADQFDYNDLDHIRNCLMEIRERGWCEFEDREEFL